MNPRIEQRINNSKGIKCCAFFMGCAANMHLISDIERLKPIYNSFDIDVFIPVGFEVTPEIKQKYPSIIQLAKSDDYASCPTKMVNSILHALDNYEYDYLICCDDDTVLNPRQLLELIHYYFIDKVKHAMLGQIRGGTRDSSDWTVHACGGPGIVLNRELTQSIRPILESKDYTNQQYSDVALALYIEDYNKTANQEDKIKFIHSTRFKNLVSWALSHEEYAADGLTWNDLRCAPYMIKRYATVHLTRPDETHITPKTPYDFYMQYFNSL